MQILDVIGHKKKSVNEGVFDTLKAAATRQPGETFAQARSRVKTDAGIINVAKKAQDAWQSYERQIQKYVSTLPAPETKTKAPVQTQPQAPAPGRRIQVPYQAPGQTVPSFYYKTSAGWTNELGQPIKDPKSIQGLEAAATKSGKEQPDPNYVAPGAEQPKKKGPRRGVQEQAPTGSALDAYLKRTDGRYEQALKAFVQKNLLAGMPYSRLQNAQEIDALIKNMSKPQNADPRVQTPLWQQLAQAAAVAAVVPQSAGGTAPEGDSETPAGDQNKQQMSARELIEPITQTMNKNQINLSKTGDVLRTNFNNNETGIRSTGNPNVDAMLLAMGFTM